MKRRLRQHAMLALLMLLSAGACAKENPFKPTAQNEIVGSNAPKLEMLFNEGEFTEGGTVDAEGGILFSDIGTRIMRFDPATKEVTVFREESGKANGLFFDTNGRLLACEGASGGNRRISITDKDGKVTALADRWEGKRFNSPNDLAVDAKTGRVYFTDPRYQGDEPREIDFEGVFVIDPDGSVKVAARDLQKPNGILVSADGKTVYVADNSNKVTGNHTLLAYRVAEDGTLTDKQLLYDFGDNRRGIDGMTLDTDGNIYATAGMGAEAGIYVFSPQGKPLAFIPVGGDPTNCIFGIGDDQHNLYITAQGPKPASGKRPYALYRVKLKTSGYHIFPQ